MKTVLLRYKHISLENDHLGKNIAKEKKSSLSKTSFCSLSLGSFWVNFAAT